MKPKIVCLCGSTRYKDEFERAMLEETLAGNIVVTIGCATKADPQIFRHLNWHEFQKVKLRLDWLHFEKIKLADEILVLNKDGYIGYSTCDEIGLAMALGKDIRYLEC